ncbi:glycosyltransferase family 4 protein [Sphaerotilus mobilis]|uniref:glycosyltransferase family 4 protein n=1 Tax=Sphaerotilus mobilis TaxID=47994 RepID=UPI0013EE9165|nr:glycosyltransferase family 4 protein [Sphaerotilus mobilis]
MSATSQMLSDLAFGLKASGHNVSVVCSRQLYENTNTDLSSTENIKGVNVHRVWTTRFGRRSTVGRAIDYLTFYVSATIALTGKVDRNSLVVAKTDPPLISIPVAAIAKLKGAKFFNWIQDLFPEVAQRAGMSALNGKIGRWISRIRDWSLERADINVVIGERMREVLLSRGISAAKLKTISNWQDTNLITPIKATNNRLISEWKLENRFVVMYSGNLGRAHEFRTIINAMTALSSDSAFHFCFVGGGAQTEKLRSEVNLLGLKNFSFHPYQRREELSLSLCCASVHLISLLPEHEGLIVPSKYYGILASGRPVIFIGDTDGELARLIQKEKVGATVQVGDAARLVSTIINLKDDNNLRETMSETARKIAVDKYSTESAVRAWNALIH